MNERLRTEYEGLDAREALQSSPAILLGVTQSAAAALKQVEIESVFDLATSRLFANASRLLTAGLDPKDPYYRYGTPPNDVVNTGADQRRIDELRFEGIGILAGIGAATAATLAEELDVKTVRDLALWPPYEAARAILREYAYLPELKADFDPEAPADLLPKSGEYPTERVFYQTLVLDQIDARPDKDIKQSGPIDIAPTLDQSFGFESLGVGALLTISQSWYAKGVALGQLLHSTTLAPGESTRIAMMDWSRRTRAGTTETISEAEQLDNETMHSRSLSEVTSALARESQQGFSSTDSTSTSTQKGTSTGSATINADPLNALSLGMFGDDPGVTTRGTSESESTVTSSGMTFTSSSGQRSVAASVNQNVLDRTQQHANSVRNRRASIIREVSQEEHQSVSTRVVTNYNHMHALSVQYYEIVQIYRVEVGISKAEKCLFVPMKLVDFNQTVIDKYRLVLARAALDRNIRELLTTRYGVVELTPQTPKVSVNTLIAKAALSQIARTTLRENLFELITAPPIAAPANPAPTPAPQIAAKDLAAIRPSMLDVVAAKGYDIAQLDSASRLVGRPLIRSGSDSVFLPDDTIITGLVVSEGYATKLEAKVRGEATRIGVSTSDLVSLTRALRVTEIESIHLKNGTDKEQVIILQMQCNYFGVFFPLNLKVRLAADGADQEVIRFGGVRAAKELIDHLNAEKLHYSQAIYRSLDASSLALLLSPYHYEGKPLAQVIDPTPVTITANYLVFKMHEEVFEAPAVGLGGDEEPAPPQLSQWGLWLKEHGIDNRVSTELVPLPSGGVFAEAVLGRYNAAEKLDMTRFWNWQDSPIPITAPEIAPVEMTSRGTTEDLKPGQLGAPVISIVNPTTLPDPMGMAAVLQAVQNGNMFRDMSGLAATMGLAQAGISAASQGATAAGAQAGSNAATAAQLFSDLVRTAATVATMGVGGVAGAAIGAGGGLLGAGVNKGAGGNITTAGALYNQGQKHSAAADGAGAGRGPAGAANGQSGNLGSATGHAPTGASDAPSAGSPNLGEQVLRSATWGSAGASQAELAESLRGNVQQVGDRYVPQATAPNQLLGLVGEQTLFNVLEQEGVVVFHDWTKNVSGNGVDLIAYDPASKKVWLIDNKAQMKGIGAAGALTGPQFADNRTAASNFLRNRSPHPLAGVARDALDRGDFIKVAGNAWAGNNTTFTKTLMETHGVSVFDIRLRRLFGGYAEWKAAHNSLPVGVHRTGMRGGATFRSAALMEGMMLVMAVAEGTLYAMRGGTELSTALGEYAAETALGAVLSRLPGGFFAGLVIGLESDESPSARAARKRQETIDQIAGSIPGFSAMSAADQQKVMNEIGTLLDEPFIVSTPPQASGPRQLLPGFQSPVPHTDWA